MMSDGKYRTVYVPWIRSESGFSLLFEAFTMKLIDSEAPVSAAKTVKETAPRIGRIFRHWVGKSRVAIDLSEVSWI